MTKPARRVTPGEVFGRLTVLAGPQLEGRYLKVLVRCECGTEKKVMQHYLHDGRTRSCGCLNREMIGKRSTTHGKRNEPLYAVWNVVVQRCTNPSNKQFKDYGGRGITVPRRWLKFQNFYADMGDPPEGLSLERRKNEKGYSKSNCYWATRSQQARNKRNSIKYFFRGKQCPLIEIAEALNMPYGKLYQRLFTYNWTFEKAIQP